ncbi:MAG: TIGR00282 family metallophosphoesterase [Deltaproteobacteria bacterium]|nr:TIGR00282 family metallophosphoesterase [Deltaproteobacteria bacterium]
MKALCIGDIVGSPGRKAVRDLLPGLIEEHDIDVVIANAENVAGGSGLTSDTAQDLLALPIMALTGGNHTWRFKEVKKLLEQQERVLRPYNYPAGAPGRGCGVFESKAGVRVGVLNLQGCVFMAPLPSPFVAADEAIEALRAEGCDVIIVDMHAEATSEKRALGWYLDGRVSLLYGTHTHVATADEEILPKGTAYITDIGMTGPHDSVIGTKKELVLERFLTMRPVAFNVAKGDVRLCGVIAEIDPESGKASAIERLRVPYPGRGAFPQRVSPHS